MKSSLVPAVSRLTMALILALTLATLQRGMATAATRNVAVCTGTTVLTFSHPLTLAGPADDFTFTSSDGACSEGLVTGPASWGGSGTLQFVGSCTEAVSTSATGTFTGPNQTGSVDIDIAGSSVAQAWAFVGVPPTQLDAVGLFAWLNKDEITACATSGTSTMTLTSTFALAAT